MFKLIEVIIIWDHYTFRQDDYLLPQWSDHVPHLPFQSERCSFILVL